MRNAALFELSKFASVETPEWERAKEKLTLDLFWSEEEIAEMSRCLRPSSPSAPARPGRRVPGSGRALPSRHTFRKQARGVGGAARPFGSGRGPEGPGLLTSGGLGNCEED
eukprot:g5430.t1